MLFLKPIGKKKTERTFLEKFLYMWMISSERLGVFLYKDRKGKENSDCVYIVFGWLDDGRGRG